jgi:hypothetical protein
MLPYIWVILHAKYTHNWFVSVIRDAEVILFPAAPLQFVSVRQQGTLYSYTWLRSYRICYCLCYSCPKSIDLIKVINEYRCFVINSCLLAGQFQVCLFLFVLGAARTV